MDKHIVYVDHAATTYVKPEVFEAMKPYFTEYFGNPSSIYSLGRESKKAIENARGVIAECLGAQPSEIYFTGSGTEADNWAIKGVAYANRKKGKHLITSAIEHHAVLHAFDYLKKEGFEVTYLPVDERGFVNPKDLAEAIRPDTTLVSIMMANNEIGTIQPIKELAAIAKEKGVIFHTDAVQAMGNLDVKVNDLNVDLLSMSAHKFYGPKGVGALYVRKGVRIDSFVHGGAQERNKRAGTENVPGIVGMAAALKLAYENLEEYNKHLRKLSNKLIDSVMERIPYVRLNGDRENRLPGNVNFSFQFIEGESLLLMLDMKGIQASSGSACTSGSLDPSHVLLAIGLPHEIAHGSLRITFGEDNTEEQVDYIVDNLVEIVERLRQMSPLYEDFVKKGQKA
ncbi:cysteine desulfurase IscS [Thermoclostridium stercorarium subsp. stercorarium DSM 8532]|jgi:cysteine desulfurase|uniref:Cysteine desulfurase IscS n=3 Tax=Thermoclostridium stercorarium TaxID=1510 RepID=L7VQR6_THES1|nr:cysteine desulfurase NifS [Thermoclostridium stercorarium]PZM87712.1 MAG: cysteine desulfurase NifS [[Clostridium] cellulosi]AGC67913.1 cysteine desulfurase IscS [Thermoclostridium stercorarium subsp. stercorarium DSM 8532]AGI38953.1 NifS [Thermoclostridium stercorarium subsp. stercorarium DSM 8532]ANW98322.1 cysteine desulfurase NifS [Thermoclostridium stercorarium subsp. thermolacticum DSM 2910]ANX00850.1 cysteine desulfurase NifS [Thermoclostridium stercorarium subsp. leptospartum DSM 92